MIIYKKISSTEFLRTTFPESLVTFSSTATLNAMQGRISTVAFGGIPHREIYNHRCANPNNSHHKRMHLPVALIHPPTHRTQATFSHDRVQNKFSFYCYPVGILISRYNDETRVDSCSSSSLVVMFNFDQLHTYSKHTTPSHHSAVVVILRISGPPPDTVSIQTGQRGADTDISVSKDLGTTNRLKAGYYLSN